MKHITTILVAASLALAGCSGSGAERQGSSSVHGEPPATGTAIVTGTTLDAATGQPLEGVVVTGPGGVSATSDAAGRFVLKGLPEGASGELHARSRDGGQTAVNVLQALRNERLEVVLHLR
jgi:hypothetical protein